MMRADHQSFVLRCDPLLSQFVVDMYAKIEPERLRFIRLNRVKSRVDSYILLEPNQKIDNFEWHFFWLTP